ncbi:MAG: ankyrin repeat domain-containing protein [Chlamydiae bacterium]|nr:ankyrin repeat domain-containing protein [Chlamydiota bacterium]
MTAQIQQGNLAYYDQQYRNILPFTFFSILPYLQEPDMLSLLASSKTNKHFFQHHQAATHFVRKELIERARHYGYDGELFAKAKRHLLRLFTDIYDAIPTSILPKYCKTGTPNDVDISTHAHLFLDTSFPEDHFSWPSLALSLQVTTLPHRVWFTKLERSLPIGTSPLSLSPEQKTILFYALCEGNLSVVRFLMNALPQDEINDGKLRGTYTTAVTPVALAIKHGHFSILKYLVEEKNALIDSPKAQQEADTPALVLAFSSTTQSFASATSTARYLKEHGALLNEVVFSTWHNSPDTTTPFLRAMQHIHFSGVLSLLTEFGADANTACSRGQGPLYIFLNRFFSSCCSKQEIQEALPVLRALLQKGANIHEIDTEGTSVLSFLVEQYVQMQNLLAEAQEAPSQKPLIKLQPRVDRVTVQISLVLKELRAAHITLHQAGVLELLMQYLQQENFLGIRALLKWGTDPLQSNAQGETALTWILNQVELTNHNDFLLKSFQAIIQALVAHGTNLGPVTWHGKPLLVACAMQGKIKAMKFLLSSYAFSQEELITAESLLCAEKETLSKESLNQALCLLEAVEERLKRKRSSNSSHTG